MVTKKKAKYPRVYAKHGSWYWVAPITGKWIRLCEQGASETVLVERLAIERKKAERPDGCGDVRRLVDEYVLKHKTEHKEKAWPSYGKYAGNALRNHNLEDVDSSTVYEVLKAWKGKLAMQRVMRAFLSGFFNWCIQEGKMPANPCRDIKLKKSKVRQTYITDEHFAAIRAAMLETTYARAGKTVTAEVPTGPMMQCMIDLCYLTAQRSTEIRELKWTDIDRKAGVIHFVPSKTEDSSGVRVDFRITPEIEVVLARVQTIDGRPSIGDMPVIHTQQGKPYAANTVLKAWKVAAERAKLAELGYTIKDIRAKALTDGVRDGYSIEALQVAGAHTTKEMTEDYIKQRNVPVADVRLRIPGRAA
jgi:integrase